MSSKNNNRCDKYKDKKTYGFDKNYVYKQCNRCPKNKIWKVNTYGGKPAIFTIQSSCHSKKESKENIERKKEQKKKKGVEYLKEQINKFKKNKIKHPNPKKSKKGVGFNPINKSRNKSKFKRNRK